MADGAYSLAPVTVSDHDTTSTATTTTRSTNTDESTKTKSTHTTSTSIAAAFDELFNGTQLYPVSENDFLAANFNELCPSHNCIEDCQDPGRLFQAVPDNITLSPDQYGNYEGSGLVPVTLFGLCSNLASATSFAYSSNNDSIKAFFPSSLSDSLNNISLVTANIASCFANTCDKTRDPKLCAQNCTADSLLESSTSFDFSSAGTPTCVNILCSNTCGLPYADQDLFGIGVLVSYYIQALLLLLLAAAIILSAAWQFWGLSQKPTVSEKVKGPLQSFIAAQCYFGISAAVASFFMHPSSVDPLNGYALIAVSLMGCIGPIFTLTLLHSHGVKSWFDTGLCFVTWLLSTVVFFMLIRNLLGGLDNAVVIDDALGELFQVSSCGGLSAMSLCQQLAGTNPLEYLSTFFNQGKVMNIHTAPGLWAYATAVLGVLLVTQIFSAEDDEPLPKSADSKGLLAFFHSPVSKFILLLGASLLFSLTLGYQYVMVSTYQKADVIDKDGWSFGQVVAVLFWMPPLLDVIHSCFESEQPKTASTSNKSGSDRGGRHTTDAYRPLAHSPAPSPGLAGSPSSPTQRRNVPQLGHLEGIEMGRLQQRRTLRMEQGQ